MMYLCSKISSKEWSGIIFYKSIGNISDLKNFKVVAEDIFLKDIGTATYTEYSTGAEEVKYIMDNPGLIQLDLGKIHSHNSMNVFHSSTDIDDLWNNTETNNYYLSFIVNNAGDVEVKIAWRSKNISTIESEYYIKDNNGNLLKKVDKRKVEESVLIIADGDIVIKKEIPSTTFIQRYETVLSENRVKEAAKVKTPVTPYISTYSNSFNSKSKSLTKSSNKVFLADFISMGNTTNLDKAMTKITNLKNKDFDSWLYNIHSGHQWNIMYKQYFSDFTEESEVASECITLLDQYKITYPEVYNELVDFLTNLIEEEFEESLSSDDVLLMNKFKNWN